MTLDTLQWIHDVGAAFIQIGHDAQVIATSSPKGKGNSELLRAQALVSASDAAVDLAREVLIRKVEGQLAVLYGWDRAKGSTPWSATSSRSRGQPTGASSSTWRRMPRSTLERVAGFGGAVLEA